MSGNHTPFRRPATRLPVAVTLVFLWVAEMRAQQSETETSPAFPSLKTQLVSPPPPNLEAMTALFAQGAVGGGYATIFALLNPLAPGKQIERFLYEDSPRLRFKGSMVLIAGAGQGISVVALVQDQGLTTAIPVIPAKAPHIN